MTRRLAWDIGDFTSIIEYWDQLTEKERSEFETVSGSLWYEYVSLVFKALTRKNRTAEAVSLVAFIIDRDRSTPEGYVIVGTVYAEWLLKNDQRSKAFEYFDWIAKESPSHRRAAVAHFWIALRSVKNGQIIQSELQFTNLRKCFGGAPALLEEWEMDASALLVLSKRNISVALNRPDNTYSEGFLAKVDRKLSIHIKKLD